MRPFGEQLVFQEVRRIAVNLQATGFGTKNNRCALAQEVPKDRQVVFEEVRAPARILFAPLYNNWDIFSIRRAGALNKARTQVVGVNPRLNQIIADKGG